MKAKIILLISAILFSLLSAEFFLRIFYPVRHSELFRRSNKDWGSRGEWLVDKGGIIPSLKLGYELRPNNPDYGINSLGMVDRERDIRKAEDTIRVLILGDSTAANRHYPDYPNYSGVLERLLNTGGRFRFEVWNCGVPAYCTKQEVEYLKLKWINYAPDMVIIGFCLNDFDVTPIVVKEAAQMRIYFPEREAAHFINSFLFTHSYLYRFIIFKLRILTDAGSVPASEDFKNISIYKYKSVYNALSDAGGILSVRGIPLLVVILPIYKTYPGEYNNYERDCYKAILDICSQLGIEYLDLVRYSQGLPLHAYKQYPDDYIHQNELGDRMIGEAIYNYLTSSGALFTKLAKK